jgi:hypothetical protein
VTCTTVLCTKNEFVLEPYLLHIKDKEVRSCLTKLRISAHKLHIETGRHCIPYRPVNERICRVCTSGQVESEVQFLLYCERHGAERLDMFDQIINIYPVFNTLSDIDKYNFLMTVNEADTCGVVAGYIRDCFRRRTQPLVIP